MAKVVTNQVSDILKVLPSNEVEGRLAVRIQDEDDEE